MEITCGASRAAEKQNAKSKGEERHHELVLGGLNFVKTASGRVAVPKFLATHLRFG